MFNFGKVKRLEAEAKGLRNTIEFKNERIAMKENYIEKQKEEIRILKHNELILLENAEESRAKIRDLENNIEFLVNNLSPQKRKLIRGE